VLPGSKPFLSFRARLFSLSSPPLDFTLIAEVRLVGTRSKFICDLTPAFFVVLVQFFFWETLENFLTSPTGRPEPFYTFPTSRLGLPFLDLLFVFFK